MTTVHIIYAWRLPTKSLPRIFALPETLKRQLCDCSVRSAKTCPLNSWLALSYTLTISKLFYFTWSRDLKIPHVFLLLILQSSLPSQILALTDLQNYLWLSEEVLNSWLILLCVSAGVVALIYLLFSLELYNQELSRPPINLTIIALRAGTQLQLPTKSILFSLSLRVSWRGL